MHRNPLVAAASMAAILAQPRDYQVIENRGQAMPKGAQIASRAPRDHRKASKRAAANELVTISNQTLVVTHLHPRWLRALVNEAMDRGATITNADVDAMRAAGSEAQARALYWGYLGNDDIRYVDGYGPLSREERDALDAEAYRG